MLLTDVIKQDGELEVSCAECRAKTPIEPRFFLARRGDIGIGQLAETIVCAGCGSVDIDVRPIYGAYANGDTI